MIEEGIKAPRHPGIESSDLMPGCLLASVPSSFPKHDPQFWLATAAFLFAAAWLLRGVVPVPWLSRRARRKKTQRGVKLTIGGKPVK